MPEVLTKHDRYVADFRALDSGLSGKQPSWLHPIRQRAMERFTQLGFPTARRGNEAWKYTNVARIAEGVFTPPSVAGVNGVTPSDLRRLAPSAADWATLVFLNGRFAPSLSTAPDAHRGLTAVSLATALAENAGGLEEHLARYAPMEREAFTALNTAFLQDGAFVHATGGDAVLSPLHLLFVAAPGNQPVVCHPRVLILTGRHAKLTVVESYVGIGTTPSFTNAVTEVVLGDDSTVQHYRLLAESPAAFHVSMAQVQLGRNAAFNTTAFSKGAALARLNLNVRLASEGSSCDLKGLHMTSGKEHIDTAIGIDHLAPHTSSKQYFKGILAGESRAVYTGGVRIHKGAVKSVALQADKNLLLSDRAEVDTEPNMEIWCDDVKASHGATAGQIAEAEDALFYMRSRGLDLETASALLIRGFAAEVLNTITLEPVKAHLDTLTAEALPAFRFERRT
ncbi:MAG: Fe-S cluster assembly protein SufD [Dehalococcoidia bacterium]|nr:Fe-S cluster assembly protein SufD [Dehalococcoidia bacterium]